MCSDSQVLAQQQSSTLYWGTNTTTGKYEHARQFFSVAMQFYSSCLVPPAVTLRLHPSVSPSPTVYPSPSLFGSLLPQLTLRLHSPDSLFPLLVFASHTLARVTLPVTCTVNWVGLNLTAVTKLSSYDLLIFKDLLWMFFVASAGIVIFLPTGSPQRRKSLWRG